MDNNCLKCGLSACNCRGGKCLCGYTPEEFNVSNTAYRTSGERLDKLAKLEEREKNKQEPDCSTKSPRCKCKGCDEYNYYCVCNKKSL